MGRPACADHGVAGLLWCIWDFGRRGRGTLAPVDPPRFVVRTGPLPRLRNPMYLSVLVALAGEVLLFGSPLLLFWAAIVAITVHLFVVAYEEPTLRRQFGLPTRRTVVPSPDGCPDGRDHDAIQNREFRGPPRRLVRRGGSARRTEIRDLGARAGIRTRRRRGALESKHCADEASEATASQADALRVASRERVPVTLAVGGAHAVGGPIHPAAGGAGSPCTRRPCRSYVRKRRGHGKHERGDDQRHLT